MTVLILYKSIQHTVKVAFFLVLLSQKSCESDLMDSKIQFPSKGNKYSLIK
jgi:hypothetical protein